jgi:competence protein ComEA
VQLPSRRSDDADVIRARLRVLLDEGGRRGGWVPSDEDLDGADHVGDGEDLGDQSRTLSPDAGAHLPFGIGRHRSPGRSVRWDPGPRGARSLWMAGLLAALLLVVWTWLDRPRVEPVPVDPAGSAPSASAAPPAASEVPPAPPVGEAAVTSATVVVSVVGLVARPGLVTLPSGSRVDDAVEAAGGLLPEADPASLNLAAVLSDGQQVAVGAPGAVAGAGPGAGPETSGSGGKVDLNTATAAELDGLPGIGPVLAERIVAHRTAQGPFTAVDQLDDVPGIGPAIAAELAGLVTV